MKIVEESNCLRLIPQSDFTHKYIEIMQTEVSEALKDFKNGNIILDLTQIKLMDSVGIKLVIGLFKTCQKKALVLQVITSSPSILRLFQLCKLTEYMEISEVKVS